MAYQNVLHKQFSAGLNLTDAPNAVGPGEAIDALNVEFSERGGVRQRTGYAQFTAAELTNQPDSLSPYYLSSGTKYLIVGNGSRVSLLDDAGAGAAGTPITGQSASPHFFARFGGPTAEVAYIANGSNQVKKISGTTFSSPGGLAGQTGKFLAVTPTSNRLVVARESGTTAGNNASSVNFSNAGDPETFTAANYIDLDPGDGEAIMGIIAWREFVFVFKETKFWVHYGESTTATGGSEFEFHKVDAGVGLVASKALCKGPEGVYFLCRQGVYRTTGGEPELVSPLLDPFFGQGQASIYFKSDVLNHGAISDAAMAWHKHRIYLSVASGSSSTNDLMLVHNPLYNWWTLYDIPAAALTSFRPDDEEELVFAAPTGANHIHRHSAAYSSDLMSTTGTDGTAISSRWRSGWLDYDSPDVKTIRETEIWGNGSVTFRLSRDFEDASGPSTTVALSASSDTWGDGTGTDTWGGGDSSDLWGPANTIRPKLVRTSVRGSVFSLSFSNSVLDTPFAIYRLENRLRESRIPSTIQTEVA